MKTAPMTTQSMTTASTTTASSQPANSRKDETAPPRDQTGDMITTIKLSKQFVKPLDLAAQLVRRFGADMEERTVHAVDEVSLSIKHKEVVGIVGESGCGKSTLGRMVAGIMTPTSGQVLYKGREREELPAKDRQAAVLAVQMIFQDPFASLNPRQRVASIIGEAPLVHGLSDRQGIGDYVDQLMREVGLDPEYKTRFAHQFSGGQRQRIGIARSLAVQPDFLVCDEAVAALDVSIQAQIINLFMDLREQRDLTYMFISHDLGVVEHICDRVVIMYLGRIVEVAAVEELFKGPNHPYARALLNEVPRLDQRRRKFAPIKGEIPSPYAPPTGCHFHPRCPHATARCKDERPVLKEIAPHHISACHLNDQQ